MVRTVLPHMHMLPGSCVCHMMMSLGCFESMVIGTLVTMGMVVGLLFLLLGVIRSGHQEEEEEEEECCSNVKRVLVVSTSHVVVS